MRQSVQQATSQTPIVSSQLGRVRAGAAHLPVEEWAAPQLAGFRKGIGRHTRHQRWRARLSRDQAWSS